MEDIHKKNPDDWTEKQIRACEDYTVLAYDHGQAVDRDAESARISGLGSRLVPYAMPIKVKAGGHVFVRRPVWIDKGRGISGALHHAPEACCGQAG